MIKFEIKNRCSGAAQFTAEIDCAEDALRSVKIGLAVKWGVKSMADLSGANLRGADLSGADLRGADLSGADLRGADLSGAPKIENIHKAIYAAASADGALNMGKWHTCETTHCRAGWAVHLAGEEGRALEENIGTAAAGALIYIASDPTLERVPNWYASNDEALADMKALAEKEPA
jgi:hypothetical protein